MADNTFYITQRLMFGSMKKENEKNQEEMRRGRARKKGRKCSGAKVFAILFEVPIQQGKLNFSAVPDSVSS